jgi:hypothetical protein
MLPRSRSAKLPRFFRRIILRFAVICGRQSLAAAGSRITFSTDFDGNTLNHFSG